MLGLLDPGDTVRFAAHLESCPDCRAVVAELAPAAQMLKAAAPADLPPPDLQARTLAAVRQAADEASPDRASVEARPDRASVRRARWRRLNARMLTLAAAVVIAAGIGAGVLFSQSAGGPLHPGTGQAAGQAVAHPVNGDWSIQLHPVAGQAAGGQAVAHEANGGWSVQLTVHRLPDLGPGRFYECWWANSDSRPGHPDLITAGTFTVGRSGSAVLQMWSAAAPHNYPVMQITTETAGDGGQHGQVILTGTATS